MTHTTRVSPVGTMFDEGYQSLITFAADPDFSFWEEVVGAPGIDGGEPVPTTTMHNTTIRTKSPRQLKEHTPFQVQGRIASGTIDQAYALINVNGWITVKWPDGTQYSFPGYLKSIQPGQAQEGTPLQATLEIVPTGQISGTETEYQLAEQGTGT